MRRLIWISAAALVIVGCSQHRGALAGSDDAIRINVTEKGFAPSEVAIRRGKPVTLVVTRKTDRTCAKEFVVAAQHVRKALPLNEPEEVTFTPTAPGAIRFACGMDMVAGRIIVR